MQSYTKYFLPSRIFASNEVDSAARDALADFLHHNPKHVWAFIYRSFAEWGGRFLSTFLFRDSFPFLYPIFSSWMITSISCILIEHGSLRKNAGRTPISYSFSI